MVCGTIGRVKQEEKINLINNLPLLELYLIGVIIKRSLEMSNLPVATTETLPHSVMSEIEKLFNSFPVQNTENEENCDFDIDRVLKPGSVVLTFKPNENLGIYIGNNTIFCVALDEDYWYRAKMLTYEQFATLNGMYTDDVYTVMVLDKDKNPIKPLADKSIVKWTLEYYKKYQMTDSFERFCYSGYSIEFNDLSKWGWFNIKETNYWVKDFMIYAILDSAVNKAQNPCYIYPNSYNPDDNSYVFRYTLGLLTYFVTKENHKCWRNNEMYLNQGSCGPWGACDLNDEDKRSSYLHGEDNISMYNCGTKEKSSLMICQIN